MSAAMNSGSLSPARPGKTSSANCASGLPTGRKRCRRPTARTSPSIWLRKRKPRGGGWRSTRRSSPSGWPTTRRSRSGTSITSSRCLGSRSSAPGSRAKPNYGHSMPRTRRPFEQKVAVEQRKAAIEVEYLTRVHEIRMRLFDLETSRMVIEEEANLKRLGHRAEEIQARIAELTAQRDEIRRFQQEATDAAIQGARETAIRQAQLIRDQNQRIFDAFKRQAEGVFDALLTKSQSIWSAIGNSLKTALLTAIKDVVTSRVAAMLMQLFTGTRVSLAGGGASGGGALGRLGGLVGVGAVPVFGQGGGPISVCPIEWWWRMGRSGRRLEGLSGLRWRRPIRAWQGGDLGGGDHGPEAFGAWAVECRAAGRRNARADGPPARRPLGSRNDHGRRRDDRIQVWRSRRRGNRRWRGRYCRAGAAVRQRRAGKGSRENQSDLRRRHSREEHPRRDREHRQTRLRRQPRHGHPQPADPRLGRTLRLVHGPEHFWASGHGQAGFAARAWRRAVSAEQQRTLVRPDRR